MSEVQSTNIRSYDYDQAERTLTITFRSGASYRYYDVPEHVVTAFERAHSKGSFFNRHIKPLTTEKL